MITKLFNNAYIFYQTSDEGFPNPAIAIYEDNGGTIVIEQENNSICLNKESLGEFANFLKKYQSLK